MERPQETVWPTPDVAGKDAFAHWREVVCQHFTRLSPERLLVTDAADGAFSGHIEQLAAAEGASLSRITATAQRVARTRADIAASPCDALFLNVQMAGRSVVRQREVETVLPTGSMTLLDARQPFDMRFDGAFEQVCFHLPVAWFNAAGLDPVGWLARRAGVATDAGVTLMARGGDWLQAGLPEGWQMTQQGGEAASADSAEQSPAAANLMALIQAIFLGRPPTLGDSYAALLQDYVRTNAWRRDLSPATVARHFRVSTRYVHRLFARVGTTFGAHLRAVRVEAAAVLLLNRSDLSVSAVADLTGFADLPAFSRAFRRETGQSPRAFRRQRQAPSH